MILLDEVSAAGKLAQQWLEGREPEIAIILGSGLAAIGEQLEDAVSLSLSELPGFPPSGVDGHSGRLHAGRLFGRPVLLFQGRYHCYEGYSAWQVTAQVRLAAGLGCKKVLLTNAAGGIATEMQAGDFMLVTDHLNLTGGNPLIGRDEREFLDLGNLYQHQFYPELQQQIEGLGIRLHQGVLAWMVGPSYETPAEIRMLAALGADAVSMSTIPDAIVARLCRMETIAIASISNLAAGKTAEKLVHENVLTAGTNAVKKLQELLAKLLSVWW